MSILSRVTDAITGSKSTVDDVHEADNLVALYGRQIAETEAAIRELEARHDAVATAALDETNKAATAAYAELLRTLEAARLKLAKFNAALRLASKTADELRAGLASAASAEVKRKVARLVTKRAEKAAELATAIAAAVTAWKELHDVSSLIRVGYPGGLAQGASSLTSHTSIARAVENKLYRLSGNPASLGGVAHRGAPSMPGAVCHDVQYVHQPERLQPLADTVALANTWLVAQLNGAVAKAPPSVSKPKASKADDLLTTALPPAAVAGKVSTAAEITASLPKRRLA